MLSTQDCPFKRKTNRLVLQKARNWRWLIAWWSCYLLGQAYQTPSTRTGCYLYSQGLLSSHNQDQRWIIAQITSTPSVRLRPGRILSWDLKVMQVAYLLRRNNINPELNFNVIMLPCALEIVLHQETFCPIILSLNIPLQTSWHQTPWCLTQIDKVNPKQVFFLTSSRFAFLHAVISIGTPSKVKPSYTSQILFMHVYVTVLSSIP